jgi:hypothetical protein
MLVQRIEKPQPGQRRWNHDECLALLQTLEKSEYWPMDPKAVGQVLEELKRG